MTRVLVTGATGFVGSHLLTRLQQDGLESIAALRNLPEDLPPSVRYVTFDLETPASIEPRAMLGVDCVYHLAARVHVMRPGDDKEDLYHTINVTATEALARAAATAGVRRFVYVSSIKVNGERTIDQPIRAMDKPAPQDPYGLSKWRAEQVLQAISTSTGLEVVVVRPPLVYGPGVGANFRKLLALAGTGLPLPFGAVDNRRSLISVWNLVDWLCHARSCPVMRRQAWLVSDGTDISTPELVRLMSTAMGTRARMLRVPVPLMRGLGRVFGRSGEVSRLVDSMQVDISDTCSEMGWRPPVGFEDGIARTVAWYMGRRRI